MAIWNKAGEFKYKVMYSKRLITSGYDNIIFIFSNGYLKFLNANAR